MKLRALGHRKRLYKVASTVLLASAGEVKARAGLAARSFCSLLRRLTAGRDPQLTLPLGDAPGKPL
jgi:hypothetical protein